ncbi:MAG: PilN domain-containing protein [bacterium]
MMKINLLKQAKKTVSGKEITVYKQLALGGAVVLIFIVVLALLEINIHNKISATRTNIAQLNQKLIQLNKVVEEINNFKKMKDQIKAKLDIINTLEKSRLAEVHLMDELSKCIPYDPTSVLSKKLWLTSLQQHGDVLGMDGVALDNATLAQFMDNLSKDPYFSDVNLSKTEQIKSNDLLLYKFSLSCKFNPFPGSSPTETTKQNL